MELTPLKSKGDCDACVESIDVVLYELHGMKMCAGCAQLDIDATTQAVSANSIIQAARTVDTAIEVKMDVFTATTTAAIQVKAAIDNDPNIAEKDRDYVMAAESLRRFQHLQKVIFDLRAETLAKENEMRAWQTQIHTFAGRIADNRKETFKNFDISYQPVKSTKSIKPTKVTTSYKKPSKVELLDASKKYDVPMAAVAMVAAQRNMTADEAARSIAANRAAATVKTPVVASN